jgi:hypothetical protein
VKYAIAILVLGLAAFALYPVLEGTPEPDDREGGSKTFAADRDQPESLPSSTQGAKPDQVPSAGVSTPSEGQTEIGPVNGSGTVETTTIVKADRPNVIKDDPVADVVFGILRDLRTGNAGAADRPDLEDRLVAVLVEQGLGGTEQRRDAAVLTVGTILRQTQQYTAGGAMDGQQFESMKMLSIEFSNDLYRRLPPANGEHTGVLRPIVKVDMPDGYEAISWATLGGFTYEEGMKLPDPVLAMKGKKVGVTGYMMTLEEVEDIHEFLLVESLWSCCFGVPPEVHQVLIVTIPGDPGIEYTASPLLILGTLDVGEEVEDGFVTSLYRLSAEETKEL